MPKACGREATAEKRGKNIMCYRIFLVVAAIFVSLTFTGCGKKGAGPAAGAPGSTSAEQKTAGQSGVKGEEAQVMSEPTTPITEEKTLFSFETGDEGFEIPLWAEEKVDNAGKGMSISKSFASEGKQSLCVSCDFPGKIWSAAFVELEQYLDFSPYRQIACDIYLPKDAPLGLKAKIILTIGDDWTWTEMVNSVPLNPGEWVSVKASLEDDTMAWKRAEVDNEFRADVRKVVIRVESNKRPVYNGPIYIDNIRVGK